MTESTASKISVHVMAVLFCLVVVAPIMLLIGDRSDPYTNFQGKVETDPAVPGQLVRVHFSGEYKRSCHGQVFYSIIDSGRNVHLLDPLPTIPDNSPRDLNKAEGKIEWVREFTLPLGVAEGKATLRTSPEYWCNPLQVYWPVRTTPHDFPFNVMRPSLLQLR